MKQLVFLEYRFMLDPSETYSNLYQFENDLSKFFDDKGIEAELIKPIEGSPGGKIFLLSKKPEIGVSDPVKMPTDKPVKGKDVKGQTGKSPKDQFKNMVGGK